MQNQYETIKNIFIQSSLTEMVVETKLKLAGKDFVINGQLKYFFWRYVYMKDLSKKTLTNQLFKAGFDNLTVVEIVDALNSTK